MVLGQLDPSQILPGGLVTPTPTNPLGIPGLGGQLVVPNLPGAVPAVPLPTPPGGGTDPNNPKVGPLPSSPSSPTPTSASLTSSPLVLAGVALVGIVLLLKVIK